MRALTHARAGGREREREREEEGGREGERGLVRKKSASLPYPFPINEDVPAMYVCKTC